MTARPMRFAPLLIGILLLASCTTTTVSDVASGACGQFRPITWSVTDTDETLRQVRAHNAVWKALCDPAPSASGVSRMPSGEVVMPPAGWLDYCARNRTIDAGCPA